MGEETRGDISITGYLQLVLCVYTAVIYPNRGPPVTTVQVLEREGDTPAQVCKPKGKRQ
jgi:hypothetical protein